MRLRREEHKVIDLIPNTCLEIYMYIMLEFLLHLVSSWINMYINRKKKKKKDGSCRYENLKTFISVTSFTFINIVYTF